MGTPASNLFLLALLLISLTGCGEVFAHLNHGLTGGRPALAAIVPFQRAVPDSTYHTLSNLTLNFIKTNNTAMLGLLSICAMWLPARAYDGEKRRMGRKVLRLDEWR